ncbi:MAG TPA: hypothetical protein VKH44_05455 [Pirellulaceae bacterium]|nr:hypothetical protein [Pirellulaceae bacterium]
MLPEQTNATANWPWRVRSLRVSRGSDQILLDLLAAVLLGFQPARHPPAA